MACTVPVSQNYHRLYGGTMKKVKSSLLAVLGLALLFVILAGLQYRQRKAQQADYSAMVASYTAWDGLEREDDPGHFFQPAAFPPQGHVRLITAEQVLELQDGIVFFGYPTCPWCRNTLPLVLETVNELGHPLYYCQLDLCRDEYEIQNGVLVCTTPAGDGYPELLDKLANHLEDYVLTDAQGNSLPVGEKRLYAPSVVIFQDGSATGFWELNLTLDEGQTKYDTWTLPQKENVKKSFQKILSISF